MSSTPRPMASQLRTETLSLSPGGTPLPAADPRAGDRNPAFPAPRHHEHAVRLAAALLRTPLARLYRGGPAGAIPVASSPDASSENAVDDPVRRVASEILRSGSAAQSVDAPASCARPIPGVGRLPGTRDAGTTCLGVPVLARRGEVVGALVVADVPGRTWQPADLERLSDLAALVGGTLEPIARAETASLPQSSRAPRPAGEQATATTPRGRAAATASPGPAELFSEAGEVALVETIRQSIVGSLHLGALHAGDRLPSIRQTARAFAVTPYMVLQAYAELELEGLVERRERSGVFVADFEAGVATSLPETGAWLTEVLTQACQHQVKIPLLPDLIRRWTNAGRLRCACVESCFDSRFSLAMELSQQFGIHPALVCAEIGATELQDLDLVITTAYHASDIGPKVAEARKPMLIATVSPLILSAALNHLRERDLNVICVDPVYGERLRALQAGAYRDRVRVITTEDTAALALLDRSEAVLLTPAARQRLAQPDFRLVAPVYPAYSLDFARKVAESLVRINLSGARA